MQDGSLTTSATLLMGISLPLHRALRFRDIGSTQQTY